MPMPSHLDLESNEEINNAAGIVGGGGWGWEPPPTLFISKSFYLSKKQP